MALLVALALSRSPKLKSLFRTVDFLPVIGITGKNWLLDPDTALLSSILLAGILNLQTEAFEKYDLGSSSALSFLRFLVIRVLNFIQFRVPGNGEDNS